MTANRASFTFIDLVSFFSVVNTRQQIKIYLFGFVYIFFGDRRRPKYVAQMAVSEVKWNLVLCNGIAMV
jgi:hypothetical protein